MILKKFVKGETIQVDSRPDGRDIWFDLSSQGNWKNQGRAGHGGVGEAFSGLPGYPELIRLT
jgi:hypothetical protein